jgi:flap endonuclease-1
MIEESTKLLEYLGVPILAASSEGEAQSAYLVNTEEAWACASQDYDTLLFGGERLVRNFAVSRSKKVKDTFVTLDIEFVSLSKLLENLKITREQLVDMGILIGTDFFEGIKGIGQHTGLELIKKYGSIENIIKDKVKVGGREIQLDLELCNQIRNIFLNPDVKKEYPKMTWSKIKYEKIEELLVEQHNFSKQRVDNALERLKKLDSAKAQISLDNFFKKS